MRIRFTRQAYRDIEVVFEYIAREDPVAAQGVLDRIETMIGHLPEHPQLGRTGRVEGTRELIVPDVPYIVAYGLNESFIDIFAIIHTAKRWPDNF